MAVSSWHSDPSPLDWSGNDNGRVHLAFRPFTSRKSADRGHVDDNTTCISTINGQVTSAFFVRAILSWWP